MLKYNIIYVILACIACYPCSATPPTPALDDSVFSHSGGVQYKSGYNDLNANQKGVYSDVGGCSNNDYVGATAPNFATSAIVGCVYTPAGNYLGIESWPDNGVAGFAITANRLKSAVGVLGAGGMEVENGYAYGGNFSVVNCRLYSSACGHKKGLDFINQYAGEFDVNLYSKATGASPRGRSTGVIVQLNSDIGSTSLGVLDAFNVVGDPGTGAKFKIAYATEDNSADVGVYLAANSKLPKSPSQSIQFGSVSNGVSLVSRIQSDEHGILVISGHDGISFESPVQLEDYAMLRTFTVIALPECTPNLRSAMAAVSDARSPKYAKPVHGGGSSLSPVFCDGHNWTTH